MTDRPGNPPPDDSPRDDDLDYLDAVLADESSGDSTVPIDDPEEGVDVPHERPADARPTGPVPTGPPVPPAVLGTAPEPVAVAVAPAMDQRWFWPILNATGLVVVIAVNALANYVEFNDQSTGDVVNKDPAPFQPAGWVFSIWSVIYLLLVAFVIYGLLPAGRRNVRLQRISPFFLVANLANVTWIFLWHWEWFLASLVTIVVLLASLLAIYAGLRMRNPLRRSIPAEPPTRVQRIVLWLPFSVYLGWIVVATLANLMVWLDRDGWDGGPFSYNVWAVLFMLAGTAVAAVFAFLAHDVAIPLVLAVAFVGITWRVWDDSMLVGTFGIVFALINVFLAGVAWVISYDRTAIRGPFGIAPAPDPATPVAPSDGPSSQR